MSTFGVTIEVGDPHGQRYEAVEALVDTGATHTVLASELIRKLNIEVVDRLAFRLADQRVEEHDVGETRIRLDGRERTVLVFLGTEGANALLGATTLDLFQSWRGPSRPAAGARAGTSDAAIEEAESPFDAFSPPPS